MTSGPKKTFFLVAMLCLAAVSVGAVEKVGRIRIRGNKNVSVQKILRVLKIQSGQEYSDEKFSEALKRLFATREFSDVRGYKEMGAEGVDVEVVVEEYPKVDEVRLEGVKHVSEEEVRKAVSMRKGTFLTPSVLSKSMEAVVDLYREKGYYRAAVHDTLVKEKGKTILLYEIDPGKKVSIKHIDFFGNNYVESDVIRDAMKSEVDGWLSGGEYKPKVLEEDNQRILDLYREHGFLDAVIRNRELVFSEDGKHLDVYYTIEEGPRYVVGDITWSGNKVVRDEEIKKYVTLHKGDVFNDKEFTEIQLAVSSLYWDRGYIYNSVTPQKSIEGNVVDVLLEIAEGKPAHVREIRISGNTKTSEKVIRRELVIHPGEIFSRPKLIRSLREVFSLGFFEAPPEVSTPPANERGDIDIELKVKEKQTGQFRLGAGFSALNSVSGFIGISETNFLGKGQNLGIDWEFSRYRQNIDFRFTEPWLLDTPTELTLNVYNFIQNQVRQQFYDDRRRGFSIRIGRPFPWYDYTTIYGRYRYESVELTNFSPGYSGPLTEIKWPQRTSSISVTLARNSTDNPFHPSKGTSSSLTAEWNGGTLLGGDAKFQRYEAGFSWYTRLVSKFVLEMNMRAGVLDGYDSPDQVPDYELFRLGGNRRYGVRGYDFYEIIPEGNPEFIGGRYMQIVSYQVSYPIAPSIYGLVFFDSGNAWNSFREADIFDLKKGAGFGIRLEVPALGTIGLDYGYGFDKRGGAGWEPHISMGRFF